MTGAKLGFGQAIALALTHAGADVVVNHFSGPDAAEAGAHHRWRVTTQQRAVHRHLLAERQRGQG